MAFAGEGNFLKKVFLPPHPYPSKTFKQGCYLYFLLCAEKNKIKCHSFFGRGDPSPTVEAHLL